MIRCDRCKFWERHGTVDDVGTCDTEEATTQSRLGCRALVVAEPALHRSTFETDGSFGCLHFQAKGG